MLKQRQIIARMTNLSIHLPQVPWWLPTTCAHPKSASRRTATAATAATTRTSVTSSPSSSARTPACVSLFIYYSGFFFSSTLFCWPLLLSGPLDSLSSASLLSSTLLRWFLSYFALFILSFLFLSLPSDQIYPIANARIVILLHYSETSHIAPPCLNVCTSLCSFVCVCVCVRVCVCAQEL